jgi:hypothetical protein
LPEFTGKDRWWEECLRKFEPSLPKEFQRDLDHIFSISNAGAEEEDLETLKRHF